MQLNGLNTAFFCFLLKFKKTPRFPPLKRPVLARDLHLIVLRDRELHYREADMLVLSRKEGEQLVIGDNVVLTINRISGNRVAIGIEAPREVRIVRGELERHEVAAGGLAPVAMSLEETNIAIASKPHE